MHRSATTIAACAAALALGMVPASDAHACGGCFPPLTESQTTVVTGHRMAFAISPTHTVLWDQIKYAGSPSEFAWVLPVRAGAVLELSHDAWFETLDAATSAQIVSPPAFCGPTSSGCTIGCGASASALDDFGGTGGAPPPVTVTHEGTVGPYETVTLHANVPNALPSWLSSHNYNIDPKVSPIIDQYTSEGFDFIALRLLPGQGVQQMKPVRVTTPGMSLSLPLRMVAAGTGANVAITLFVIGEGRYEPQNFPNAALDPSTLTWDFASQSSDYATKRLALMAKNGGRTWNDAFANQGSLLSQDYVNGFAASITVGGETYSTFAQAFVAQALANGEVQPGDTEACTAAFNAYATSTDQVIDCAQTGAPDGGAGGSGTGTGGGGTGGSGTGGGGAGGSGAGGSSAVPDGGAAACQPFVAPADDDASYACGPLDDIAVALLGLHPADVWLTRLESNLPHAALATDLVLQASPDQSPVSNVLSLTQSTGNACPGSGTIVDAETARRIWRRNQLALFASILALVAATLGRRRSLVPVHHPL